jgi:hypothetical protein
MLRTRLVSFVIATLLSASLFGSQLPNFDQFGAQAPNPSKVAVLQQKAQSLGVVQPGMPMQSEARLGVPTFVWPSAGAAQLIGGHDGGNGGGTPAEAAARAHLNAFAPLYNLEASDINGAVVRYTHDLGAGPIIVKMQQTLNGIELFHEEVNVVMNRRLELVAISGYISSKSTPANYHAGGTLAFRLNGANAATHAVNDVTLANIVAGQLVPAGSHDGYDYYTTAPGARVTLAEPVRVKKVYYHTPDGLEPAYFVEVIAHNDADDNGEARIDTGDSSLDAYSYIISAVDGSVLFRNNLIAEAQGGSGGGESSLGPGGFTYRVWADPGTGIPYDTPAGNSVHPKINATPDGVQYPFVAQQLVTLPNFPFSQNDPWLAPGSTQTSGNNVEAFGNLVNAAGNVDNGFGPAAEPPADPALGDHHAFTSAVDTFNYTHQPDVDAFSVNARQASITQLFYNINFLHDWYYDAGFNELAGNAQTNNFARGGLGSDNIKGQAQDTSSFSNANMLTPADGTRPRMRKYNFPNPANMLDLQAPAALVSKVNIGISQTGKRDFDVTSNIVIATFSNSPSACTITNAAALTGNIAMFDFDNTDGTGCSFSTRITRIHATSALAALMVYTSANATAVANITGIVASHTKGVGVISWNNGQAIKAQLAGNTVTARLLRVADRDGSNDQQIVAHEWAHYLSNRLVGNASGLNSNYSGGMGEGWGDFSAMLLTVREADTGTTSNDNWQGAYALATYATSGVPFNGGSNQGYYYGIRRYPYSTDMAKNPLTFQHIANGTPLPVGPPVAFGATGTNNAEVHNTGEVWTTMLWECYAALLRDTLGPNPRMDFTTAQARMKTYIVASLKMTPLTPTMLETRDAVLAAAAATDLVDYKEFMAAFAKRGAGIGAISPDRWSGTNSPVTESYLTGGDLAFVSAQLDDSTSSCDNDGVLDNNERGKLTVTLKNTGDQSLTATTATITSGDPNVTIGNGGLLNFPASPAAGTTAASIDVTLAGAVGIEAIDFTISYNDPNLAVAGPRNVTVRFAANRNTVPASTATDNVEADNSLWTSTAASSSVLFTYGPWVRQQDPAGINHFWFGPDNYFGSDIALTSPVMTVNGGGSVNLQFDHSFGFEFDGGGNYDGGVVEFSVNGGAFTDMGTGGGLPNYNGTIVNYSGDVNPLKGRTGFVQNSGGTIHTSFTKAIAPGSTVQVRFRAGSDNSFGAAGWTLDNIAISGVVETPFGTVVADPGCTAWTSTALIGTPDPGHVGAMETLTATVSSARAGITGTVTFFDGVTPLGTNPLVGNVATLTTSSLAAGSHTLTATYNPVPGFGGSTSSPYTMTIDKATSTTVLTSTVNPVNLLPPVTYFATVTTSTGATAAGSVTFYDGVSTVSTATLNGSGVAAWSTVYAAGGVHPMSAVYNGNTSTLGSTSAVLNEYVNPAKFSFAPSTYYALENAGTILVTVTRTGGSTAGAASVNFNTADGSAVAGVRYTTTSTTVNFAAGEASKTVAVPLLNTPAIEGMQAFTATLSSPVGGTLGAVTTATINVVDDDTVASDFSSDGKPDIVWRNATTGDTRVWHMNGTSITSSVLLQNQGSPLVLAGIGDFNADGQADVLWRNSTDQTLTVWFMNGTTFSSSASVPSSPDANWKPVAIGDFNGDGFADIVWRHTSSGATNVWLLQQTTLLTVVALPTVPDANWKVIGVGDFNRDKKADLVWRNGATLDCAVWLMNGTTFTTAAFLPKVGYPWQLVGIGDMNGDGDADMIWQTTTTRQIALWQMNQTALGSAFFISTAADPTTANDPNYAIVAPR